MAWLTRGDDVLATVERRRGYPDPSSGTAVVRPPALLLRAPKRTTLDVAWCRPVPDDQVEVKRVRTLGPHRPACPGWGAPMVLLAAGGAFERWGLRVGDRLSLHGD